MVVLVDIELLLDLINGVDSDVTGSLEAIRNLERVDALFQKFLGLLEDGTSEHDNTSGAVTNLVVLRGGQLGQKPGSLMVDLFKHNTTQHKRPAVCKKDSSTYLHLLEDSGTVVGDDNLTVRGHKHLVHALGAEGSLHHGGNSAGSHNVDLDRERKEGQG